MWGRLPARQGWGELRDKRTPVRRVAITCKSMSRVAIFPTGAFPLAQFPAPLVVLSPVRSRQLFR
ncbi:hypothetical protein GCM10010195_23870 [Kitasatospora griseola]|nr:hypothetical protein GCM10010195_23870 [Kitasatospora griseola]